MRLHLLAPTIVDFSCAPGAALRDAGAYDRYWQARAAEAADVLHALVPDRDGEMPADGAPPRLSVDHQRSSSRSNRYRTIDTSSLERPLQVLTWSFAMDHLPVELDHEPSEALRGRVTEVTCRLYDHDVMLVELAADVDCWFAEAGPAATERRTDELQEAAVELGAAVARECHDRYVAPTLTWLRTTDRHSAVMAGATDLTSYPSGQEPGNALWVARALVVDPEAGPEHARVLRHWVKDIPRADTDDAPPTDRLVAGGIDHLTRWLNYVYIAGRAERDPFGPKGRFEDVWEALRCAQFFYSALDTVDSRLSMVLAEAFVAESRWELSRLESELAVLSGRAQLVLMQFHDIRKYLKRSVRQEMDGILRYWSFTEVVEEPVVAKVEACQRRLSDLGAKQAARSALFTDLILLGIGITSVLGTAVALAEFGRVMASDPNLSAYDVTRDDVTGWFAAQPADAILLASGAVSLVLVIVYLYFRRAHDR